MRRRRKDVFDKVLVLRLVRRDAYSSAVLTLIFRDGLTFDVSAVRHRNDDILFFDKVGDVDFGIVVRYLAAARSIVGILDFEKFFFDNIVYFVDIGENFLVVCDFDFFLGKFLVDFFHFERGKSSQTHFEDSRRLFVA